MTEHKAEPLTGANVDALGEFAMFRKTALSRVSTFTVPPGTVFETPEGLSADDEECRVAFDVQGGVYPIRESVFRATYIEAEAATPPDDREGLAECPDCGLRVVAPLGHHCGSIPPAEHPRGITGFYQPLSSPPGPPQDRPWTAFASQHDETYEPPDQEGAPK